MSWLGEIGWLGLFGEYLIKSTAALSCALLLFWLFRKQSACLRHLLLSLFLIGLLLFPLLSTFPSGWETRLLPSRLAENKQNVPAAKVHISQNDHLSSEKTDAVLMESEVLAMAEGNVSLSSESHLISKTGSTLGYLILISWSAGALLLLLRLMLGLLGAIQLTTEGVNLEDSMWGRLLQRFLAVISLRRKVRLKSHSNVIVPLTWGLIRPVILMPSDTKSWTEEQRSTALFHELSHVKRADFLIMMLIRVSLALFWFNPLSWLVFRMIKKEQEKACDELVLRAGIKPSTYAASLLSFKNTARWPWNPSEALLGLFGRSQLNDRLAAILKQKLTLKEVKLKTKIIFFVTVILAITLIGMARPSAAPSAPEDGVLNSYLPISGVERAPQEVEAADDKGQEKPEKAGKEDEKSEKKKEVKTIVIEKTDKKDGPLEIIITEGDKTKKIVLGESIVIKGKTPHKILVTSPEGKKILSLEGGFRIKIEGDKLTLHKDSGAIKVGKEATIHLEIDDEEEAGGIVFSEPVIEIEKESKHGEKVIFVRPHTEVGRPHITVRVKKAGQEKELMEIQEELEKIREGEVGVKEALKECERVIEDLEDMELRQELEETFERLEEELEGDEESREKALQELEETIEELSEEMEIKKERVEEIDLVLGEHPTHFTIVRKQDKSGVKKDFYIGKNGQKTLIVYENKKGVFSVVFQGKSGEIKKDAYEKAVEKIKKDLPEGCELESEFKEDSGTVIIKITGCKSAEEAKGLIDRLVKEL